MEGPKDGIDGMHERKACVGEGRCGSLGGGNEVVDEDVDGGKAP